MIAETARRFPGRASVHLIVGLGETEQEMVTRMLEVQRLGLGVGLFAFTPLRGTPLSAQPQPPIGQYRRMQVARWLIMRQQARQTDFMYDASGTLRSIALADWPARLSDGKAFRTAGCPDCNRPFYNERPGGTMYNYPRPLTRQEIEQCILEIEIAYE